MVAAPFVGREEELQHLRMLLKKKTASLAVIRGRRRVGKSRLVEEFAKDTLFYRFVGLFPGEGITAQSQRDDFSYRLSIQADLPEIQTDDWNKLFGAIKDIEVENVNTLGIYLAIREKHPELMADFEGLL